MKFLCSRLIAAVCATALIICASFLSSVQAQPTRSAPEVYAIVNARIVTVSGANIERGTIVVRDGLIQAVGANVTAPGDARIIDGSGLTVYPGFIDANSSVGIPAAAPRPAVPFAPSAPSATNSIYPAGLQPEIAAQDLLRAGDASFETWRNQGFTTALTVPRERIFAGQSALIETAGDNVSNLVLRAPAALHISFVSLPGGTFPTALMGTFAAIRQMMLDAGRLQTAQKLYAANPRGARRPDADKSLEALIPVLNGTMPVVFNVNSEREIIRALDLAKEFNLRSMIAGGNEAYKVIDRLKTQNVPVLLSLNLPKRTTAASTEADPETLDVLRLRVEAPKNAVRLKQAGIRFAFQSGGAANLADFWTNANRVVENGLTRPDALRAMTLNAAEIFGVDKQLGSIETGKIANLTVTRGDVFDKTRTFTHVFVDGRMFEIKQPAARPAAAATGAATPRSTATATTAAPAAVLNLSGTWTISVEIPGQPTQATLVLTQQENRLTGSLESGFGNSEIKNGEITADGFRFVTTITVGQTFDVLFNGKINGSQITGTATSPQGAIPFSGTKNP